jgi:hypothetical protein
MTTKLLEAGGKYELWADIGRFELPEPANENYAPAILEAQAWFKEKLLSTTALTRIQSAQLSYNRQILSLVDGNWVKGVIDEFNSRLEVMWKPVLNSEEVWTIRLAYIFWTHEKAFQVILQDRLDEVNMVGLVAAKDTSPSLLQAA